VENSKDSEEKMQALLKQQQKLFQQQCIVQAQRLKTIKQLHKQYMKVSRTNLREKREVFNMLYILHGFICPSSLRISLSLSLTHPRVWMNWTGVTMNNSPACKEN